MLGEALGALRTDTPGFVGLYSQFYIAYFESWPEIFSFYAVSLCFTCDISVRDVVFS